MGEVKHGTANLDLVERGLIAPTRGVDLVALFRDDRTWAEMREAMRGTYADDCVIAWVAFGQRSERYGPEGLRQGWLDWFEPWAEYRSETEEVRLVGEDRVLLFARQVGTPHDGAPIEMHAAALVTIRDDRIGAIDFYATREEAMAAAGVA